jgi:hypothetical protein
MNAGRATFVAFFMPRPPLATGKLAWFQVSSDNAMLNTDDCSVNRMTSSYSFSNLFEMHGEPHNVYSA